MITNCLICKRETFFLRKYKNNHECFNNLNLYKCKNCDFVFANPMPLELLLEKFNSTYFDSAHGGFIQNKISSAFFQGISKIRYFYFNKFVTQNRIANKLILEIGPGKGHFADIYLKNNITHNYYVIETDKTCHDSLTKIGAKLIDFKIYLESDLEFDSIIISHVLEHVSDPIRFLNKVTTKLKKGGVLYIDVPCNDFLHKNLDEPHLLFFDKLSMFTLLNNLDYINIQTKYFGPQIKNLVNKNKISILLEILREKLIYNGFYFLFGRKKVGMSMLDNSLELAVMKPYLAHKESDEPAWWLRTYAIKKNKIF
jgi:SAM-dependent methyltransferase